jgi:hypothetical protein
MHFDVTELYRAWAEGGPFPSRQRTVEPGTPLVVDGGPGFLSLPGRSLHFEDDHHVLPAADGSAPARW